MPTSNSESSARAFDVKYLDRATGNVARARMNGVSAPDIEQQLHRDERILLSLQPAAALPWSSPGRAGRRLDVALFCEELKSLLQAGLNLVEALEVLEVGDGESRTEPVARQLLQEVRRGKPLSEAMARQGQFPRVLVAVIKGSEFTSGVAGALERYLATHRRLDDLKARVIGASIYPAIVLGLGALIVLFLLGFVVPRFSAIYAEHAGVLGGASGFVLDLGAFVAAHWVAVVVVLAAALLALTWWILRLRGRPLDFDAMREVPVIGTAVADLEAARMFETLAMLIGGGFTVTQSLNVASEAAISRKGRADLASIAHDVERGRAISAALRTAGLGGEVAARLAAAGEQAGSLGAAMAHVGEYHARRFARRVDWLSRVVEPALLVLVGMTIGMIVLLMYMPIFDLAGGVR